MPKQIYITIHIACQHEEKTALPTPGRREVNTEIAHPNHPNAKLRMLLHPRWCAVCKTQRMNTVEGILNHLSPDQKAFPAKIEAAFTLGLQSGRRLGVELDFNMGFQAASQEILKIKFPRNMSAILRTILPGDYHTDRMLRYWQSHELLGSLQTDYEDLSQIETISAVVGLTMNNRETIREMVRKYRLGQLKGLYWLWRLEALALAEISINDRLILNQDALLSKIPRWESSYRGILERPKA